MQNQLMKLNAVRGGTCFVVRKGGLWKFMGGDGEKLLRDEWERADSRGGIRDTQHPPKGVRGTASAHSVPFKNKTASIWS